MDNTELVVAPAAGQSTAVAQGPAGASDSQLKEAATVTCSLCGQSYPPGECVHPSKNVWKCKPCNVASVQTHRTFGGMPAELDALDEDSKSAFWIAVREGCANQGTSKRGAMRAVLCTALSREAAQISSRKTHGEYQPLGFWDKKGYDVERIKATATEENTREHAQLGTTYKQAAVGGCLRFAGGPRFGVVAIRARLLPGISALTRRASTAQGTPCV